MPDNSFSSTDTLPDDVAVPQGMVAEFPDKLAERDSVIERRKHEVPLLRQWRFGRKSEKLEASGQLSLFPGEPAVETKEETPAAKPAGKGRGRKPIPANLPVERIEIDVPTEELVCRPRGSEKVRIGEETRRELDYIPGSILVREYVRPVYACPRECEGQIVVAANPSSPIEKGLPGPGLLAHAATSKYADHLPLNRMEGILRRHGVDIRRSTMADWMARGAHLLTTLHEEMKRRVPQSAVIHTDETPVTAQDPKGKSKPHTGGVRVYSGDRHHPCDVYEYSPDRKREHPHGVFSGWKGFPQADAYQGHNALYGGDIVEVACWAHARRKFVEAEKSDRRAAGMLGLIQRLYRVEKRVKSVCQRLGWSFDSPGKDGDRAEEFRRRRREKQSIPIPAAIGDWLHGPECSTALPKSPFGEAVGYCLNNWRALSEYALHGQPSIDNSAAERKPRPAAAGRKNYLFFGSDNGGRTAAAVYSVISSAKRRGLDPWRCLRNVFSRLPDMTVSQLPELLPNRRSDSHE
jgi:transposase